MMKVAHSSPSPQDGFPVHIFPQKLADYLVEAAHALGVTVDMVAVPALAAASAAIGASRHIRLKESWTEHAALFVAVVAPTGSLKTPSLRQALFPVLDQQGLFAQETMKMTPDNESGQKSAPPRTYTSDATVEALGQLLEANPYGVLLYCDELSGWVKSMNQYRGGKGADRQFFLRAWSGTPITVDRVGRPSIQVAHPHLSVVGGIPPDILPELADNESREDGFLPRILFAYPEQSPVRWSEIDISHKSREDYVSLFGELYELGFENDPATGKEGPIVLSLTSDGRKSFVFWHDSFCHEMEAPTLSPVLKGFYSKLRGYCARLALIHALCGNPNASCVGVGSVEAAIRMVEYFKHQAEKVCALLAQPKKTPLERCEKEILKNLSHGRMLTKRELQQGGNAKGPVFNPIFRQLVASGRVIETQKPGKRGPVKAFQLANQG